MVPPNILLGPSEANLDLSSTINSSKDSYEVLRAQEWSLNIWRVEEPQLRIPSLHLLETAASTHNFWGTASFYLTLFCVKWSLSAREGHVI